MVIVILYGEEVSTQEMPGLLMQFFSVNDHDNPCADNHDPLIMHYYGKLESLRTLDTSLYCQSTVRIIKPSRSKPPTEPKGSMFMITFKISWANLLMHYGLRLNANLILQCKMDNLQQMGIINTAQLQHTHALYNNRVPVHDIITYLAVFRDRCIL